MRETDPRSFADAGGTGRTARVAVGVTGAVDRILSVLQCLYDVPGLVW